MKPHTLPIKRKPVTKGILHKLSAVTRSRKQRVAAATHAGDMEADEGSSKIARALTIIFLIHIVAVGLIFVHQHFLKKRMPSAATITTSTTTAVQAAPAAAPVIAATPAPEAHGRLASGDKVYVVKPGDSYAAIAEREGVAERDLRSVNENVEIRPGLILSVPQRRVPAQEATGLAAGSESQSANAAEPLVHEDDGLVQAIDVAGAPRAAAVSNANAPASAPATTGSRTHTVKSGDNIWRISQQYKVKQDDLMKANNITDARKVRIGMKLVIPD